VAVAGSERLVVDVFLVERENKPAKLLPLRSWSACCVSAACAATDIGGAADLLGEGGATCGDSRRRLVACSKSPPVASRADWATDSENPISTKCWILGLVCFLDIGIVRSMKQSNC
jgi:hypothetical protein